jgi:DNA-binding XRE family transcriptional regulator
MTPVMDDSPLMAGAGDIMAPQSDPYIVYAGQAREMAKEAARYALREYRQEQKRGRNDRGSGDKKLGGIVLGWRNSNNITQAKLSEWTGLHPTTIGKIETGDRGMSFETFCRLITVFGSDFAWEVAESLRYKG